jgi:hypothetical protein
MATASDNQMPCPFRLTLHRNKTICIPESLKQPLNHKGPNPQPFAKPGVHLTCLIRRQQLRLYERIDPHRIKQRQIARQPPRAAPHRPHLIARRQV